MPALECPSCHTPMDEIVEPDVAIDVCATCGGRFLDKGELNELATGLAGDIEFRSVVWTDVMKAVEGVDPQDAFPVRSCPRCSNRMKKVGLVPFVDVVFDHCEDCGCFFLDTGEVDTMNRKLREASLGGVADEYRSYHDGHLVRGNKLRGVELVPKAFHCEAVPAVSIQIVAYFKEPLGVGLSICAEKWTAKLAKAFGLFGKQDIPVGDDEFDAAFIVRGNDRNEIVRVLSQEIRHAILGFSSSRPSVSNVPGSIEVLDYCLCFTEGPYRDKKDEVLVDWENQPRKIIDELVRIAELIDQR